MKKYLLLFILVPTLFLSQISLKNVFEISKLKKEALNNYITNGLGFKRVKEKETENTYNADYYNGKTDFDDLIYIEIKTHVKNENNLIQIKFGKNINLNNFKSEIISNGFMYNGEKEIQPGVNVLLYDKNNNLIIISKEPNKYGLTEISVIPENK